MLTEQEKKRIEEIEAELLAAPFDSLWIEEVKFLIAIMKREHNPSITFSSGGEK